MGATIKIPDEATEPERLEQRAEFYLLKSRAEKLEKKVGYILLAAEAQRYAANLRAMRAARMRTQML